jgi:hypothetical protein
MSVVQRYHGRMTTAIPTPGPLDFGRVRITPSAGPAAARSDDVDLRDPLVVQAIVDDARRERESAGKPVGRIRRFFHAF